MNTLISRSLLILLLAMSVLLMQTYAVWHEAEHPFHEHVAECDRLTVISQQGALEPTAEVTAICYPTLTIAFFADATPRRDTGVGDQYSIRGPPNFS